MKVPNATVLHLYALFNYKLCWHSRVSVLYCDQTLLKSYAESIKDTVRLKGTVFKTPPGLLMFSIQCRATRALSEEVMQTTIFCYSDMSCI